MFFRNKNEVITHLIEAATKFISNTRIKTLVSMETTIAILLRKIAAAPNYSSVQPNLSEELKLNIIKCVEATYRRSTSDVIEQFYGKQNLNVIAQSLSITENILSNESYRPLRYEQKFNNLSMICDRVVFFFFV